VTTKKEALSALRILREESEKSAFHHRGVVVFSTTREHHCLELLRAFISESDAASGEED
jgi:hypothetical protein